MINLTVRSKASFLHASCDIDDLIKKVKESGQHAVGLADYGNLYNAIKFYKTAKKQDIKPILGCTVYLCQDIQELKQQKIRRLEHITLIAENQVGWKNLVRLVSDSNKKDNFYFFPRVDFAMLEKYKSGLILLSGGIRDSIVASSLVSDKPAVFKAEAIIRRLLSIFDNEHFYLEVQPGEDKANNQIRNIAHKYSLKTIATNNIHYLNESDAEAHKTLLKMNASEYSRLTNCDFSKDEFYFRTNMVGFTDDELKLSDDIANRCDVNIDLKKNRLPKYKFLSQGQTAIQFLTKLTFEGLNRLNLNNEEYINRAKRELKDIEDMGFADYFLIVQDVLNWCRQQNMLLGRGRGSAAGSLICYALGITEVDPIQYNLIWERFLNKGRVQLPDIDSDVPRSKRQEVLSYIKERFGNVAQLVNFNGLQARAILKEVFRVFNMSFDEANKITSLVPAKNDDHSDISIDDALKMSKELQEYEKKYKAWFSIARSLEGCYKNTGIHAAAVIISDVPFDESDYLLTRSKDGDSIFGWDMDSVDDLHLLKLDVLGVSTLDDVQETFKLINDRRGLIVDRSNIPLDDKKTFDLFSKGLTIGIFQLETQLGRNWSKKVSPSKLTEVADLVSLLRPATLETGLAQQYVDTKNGKMPFTPAHPLLTDITKNTYGILCYQEETIFACQQLAGFSLQDADSIRKVIGKKKPEELREWKPRFIDGCRNKQIDSKNADDIWSQLEKFAGYQFNYSHGLSYAMLSYETAYLKANYPIEFFCAKLKTAKDHPDKFERIGTLIYDAKLFDIKVLPPRNTLDFSILNDKEIAFGLSSIKGIGKGTAKLIIGLLNKFDNFDTFIFNSDGISSSAMEGLIKSGSLDFFKLDRVRMWAKYQLIRELSDKELELIKNSSDWIQSLNDLTKDNAKEKFNIKRAPDSRRKLKINEIIDKYSAADLFDNLVQNAKWEQEFLGISLTSHTLGNFKGYDKCLYLVQHAMEGDNFDIIIEINGVREIYTKKGDPMAFISGKDESYNLDSVVIFPKVYEKTRNILVKNNIIRIRGRVDQQNSFIANKIERVK